MIRLDAATVLLQWATGGLFFLWVTTRHRLVGIGYGWLLRWVYGIIAVGALVAATFTTIVPLREAASAGLVAAAFVAFVVSYVRRKAGVKQQREQIERKKARVASMVTSSGDVMRADVDGDRDDPAVMPDSSGSSEPNIASATMKMRDQFGRSSNEVEREMHTGAEFPPWLDLVGPAIGLVGLVAAGANAGAHGIGGVALAIARTVIGALFLGAVSDAMLLGHWYLVQPGLSRKPISELNDWLLKIWPFEVAVLLIPTGMISVINGKISDHYNGMLGWFWIACALMTGGLAYVTRLALRERFYSAVMAATGLLYLAILTAFGTDLVARAILAG
jgi:hypothetical protein